jgi:hypothetical protein
MKFLFTAILISVVFSNLIFPQKYSGRKFHPYSGTMVLTAEGGITLAYTDYKGSEHDYLGRASLEYYFPAYSAGSFGLKVFSGVGFIAEEDLQKVPDYFRTKLSFIGAGIVYTLSKRALSVEGYLVNLGIKSNQLDIIPMMNHIRLQQMIQKKAEL